MSKGTEKLNKGIDEIIESLGAFEENIISKLDKIRNRMIIMTVLFVIYVIIIAGV